tara:strand:- start:56 stop:577 length:522 start_codon:yes stop_codon:yes gene_type:complete
MAKNNPPNLTKYIQDARREGYTGTNREEAIEYLKNKKNEGDSPKNYGTMKQGKNGGGTNYFSMNYMANKNNAQDADTVSTFKDPEGVAMAGGTTGLNDGHMNYGTPYNHGSHTEEKDGHSHGGVVNTIKNFARNNLNPKIKYGSSGQQGGLSQRRPANQFRPLGPTDEELKNK